VCFRADDYEYVPEVTEVTDPVAASPVACGECARPILPGETYREVYHRERETCAHADDDGACRCRPGECDHGREDTYARCPECSQVLQAVEATEKARNCPPSYRRPILGGLAVALADDPEYADKALAMFPKLRSHLWRLTGDPEAVGPELAELGGGG
jgi:hypothetical protein